MRHPKQSTLLSRKCICHRPLPHQIKAQSSSLTLTGHLSSSAGPCFPLHVEPVGKNIFFGLKKQCERETDSDVIRPDDQNSWRPQRPRARDREGAVCLLFMSDHSDKFMFHCVPVRRDLTGRFHHCRQRCIRGDTA